MAEDLKAIARRIWEEIFPACDVDALREVTDPDAIAHGARPGEPAGFEGFIRALAVPATAPEIPPAPTAPPDMGPVLRAAADYGLEILGPPGIPA